MNPYQQYSYQGQYGAQMPQQTQYGTQHNFQQPQAPYGYPPPYGVQGYGANPGYGVMPMAQHYGQPQQYGTWGMGQPAQMAMPMQAPMPAAAAQPPQQPQHPSMPYYVGDQATTTPQPAASMQQPAPPMPQQAPPMQPAPPVHEHPATVSAGHGAEPPLPGAQQPTAAPTMPPESDEAPPLPPDDGYEMVGGVLQQKAALAAAGLPEQQHWQQAQSQVPQQQAQQQQQQQQQYAAQSHQPQQPYAQQQPMQQQYCPTPHMQMQQHMHMQQQMPYTGGYPAQHQGPYPGAYGAYPHAAYQAQGQQYHMAGQMPYGMAPNMAPQPPCYPGQFSGAGMQAHMPQALPAPGVNAAQQAQTEAFAHGLEEAKKRLASLRTVVDAVSLMRRPGRAFRPPRLLIVLRGLPGSGKSHLARKLREMEVEEGGEPPRVHSIDDYFMVEDGEDDDDSSSSARGGGRGGSRPGGKRTAAAAEKQAPVYKYDAKMEGAYQKALVKGCIKTLEDKRFSLVVLDAPHARTEEYRDVLDAAQRLGYEAYVCAPSESDPATCAKRNIHSRTLAEIEALAKVWEEPPPTIPLLDAGPLLSGKRVAGSGAIAEVEMGYDEGAGTASGKTGDGVFNSSKKGSNQDGDTPSSLPSSSRWLSSEGGDGQEEAGGDGSRRGAKRAKGVGHGAAAALGGLSDDDILAGVNSALQQLDEDGDSAGSSKKQPRSSVRPEAAGQSSVFEGARQRGFEPAPSEVQELLARARQRLRKRVWWADLGQQENDEEDAEEGGGGNAFRMQTPTRPLCEVRVVEGLGPAPGDTALQYMDASSPFMQARAARAASFADQVRAEHHSEHDVLTHTHLNDSASKDDE